MPIVQALKNTWEHLLSGPPGQRFQLQYRRRQQARRSPLARIFFIGSGIVIIAAGVFLLPAPGPGSVIVLLGGVFIAQESEVAARALDWAEVRLRRVAAWGFHRWQKASVPAKIALVIAAIVTVAGISYAGYRLFFLP
jgi:uncharacterized protein (TIGR02611 family)